jgi:pyruvate-formate lyase-activating enzyme
MPRLDNETDLEYKRRVIDIKSSSFCGAKWYNATVWLGSGMTTSCHHPLPHKVSVEEVAANPKALHNTPRKKEERRQMQTGERPAGCEYCWKIEDMGRDAVSDRVYKTVIYTDEDLDDAYHTPADQDIDLQTLEIAFDRTCQFACSYCNPAFSSAWVRDIKQHGPYTGLVSDGRNHFTHAHDSSQLYTINDRNPYVDAFFQWWESDLHRTLKELRITGGEPLMSGYTWRLLDWFKQNQGRSQTRLAINSNLGMSTEDVVKLLDRAQGITLDLYTSNESLTDHAEYIRDGLSWSQWMKNMHMLAGSKRLRGLHVMMTINALCLESITEFLDVMIMFKEQYGRDFPTFTLNILRFPSFQSPLVLPDNIRQRRSEALQKWFDDNKNNELLHQMELNQVQRLIDYLDVVKTPHSDTFDRASLHNDFRRFYEQYDQRRDKSFRQTFPALARWYDSIQV